MGFIEPRKFEGIIEGERIIWEGEGEVAWLEPYGRDALRFRSSKSLRIQEDLDWTLLKPTTSAQVEIQVEEHRAIIRNGIISAEITGDGAITYYKNGALLLKEFWKDHRNDEIPLRRAREFKTIASEAFKIDLYFGANQDEHFYGLGQDPNDCFDLKGTTVELLHKNTKSSIPYIYSSRGYGFLWNNPAIGRVELVGNHTLWHAEAAKQIDYVIIAGDSPDSVMERFTELTGRAPLLPEWAAGFWQCKLRYETQEELLEVAREYKRRGLPISVIVIDYFHWTQQGEWKFDKKYWPDPSAMVKELEEMGIKVMVSIWPTVDPRSENYSEMLEKNCTIRAEKGVSTFFHFLGPETYFDATHPGARDYVWQKAKQNYYDHGIKMFWLDEAEPEMRPYDYDNVRYYEGNGLEVSNLYPFMYAKAFYDGMKAEGEDVVNLVRCAWVGTQRLGAVVWSGDIASTFDSLRKQLKAGLNIAMCGIPWWTTDIGGFLDGHPDDPAFRELLVRWFQFGVFCPIFRLHGYRLPYVDADFNDPMVYCHSGGPNEAWSFGEEAYEIIKDHLFLREKMLPYIMAQMERASSKGTPVMRPLLYDFPDDEKVYQLGDEYMFGPDILVAPIIEAGVRSRKVYLPQGATWTEAMSGQTYDGGQTVEADAPLESIPVFYKNGFSL